MIGCRLGTFYPQCTTAPSRVFDLLFVRLSISVRGSAATAQDRYYQRPSRRYLCSAFTLRLHFPLLSVNGSLSVVTRRIYFACGWGGTRKQHDQRTRGENWFSHNTDGLVLDNIRNTRGSLLHITYMIHVDRNAEFEMGLPAEDSSLPRSKYLPAVLWCTPIDNHALHFECVVCCYCMPSDVYLLNRYYLIFRLVHFVRRNLLFHYGGNILISSITTYSIIF